jgi:hypothetical protein
MSGRQQYRLRQDAISLFDDRDGFMEKFYEVSMVEIHNDFSYYLYHYEENLEILNSMLWECMALVDEEDLEYILEKLPNFVNYNYVFCLGDLIYEDRDWIYRHEIEAMKQFILEKMAEYEKFKLELDVKAGVQVALLRRNYPKP